ncbi:hypothetical protein ACQEVF_17745 [Nonomuraea polychroma]|uniref:hypothetical protein n=1 Tax=Nonomuraea polychroma TaxID=46176 RepID=UPI003D8C1F29
MKEADVPKSVFSRLRPALPVLLVIAGLALLSAAAWTLAVPAGLAVAGLSAFVLEWRITGVRFCGLKVRSSKPWLDGVQVSSLGLISCTTQPRKGVGFSPVPHWEQPTSVSAPGFLGGVRQSLLAGYSLRRRH